MRPPWALVAALAVALAPGRSAAILVRGRADPPAAAEQKRATATSSLEDYFVPEFFAPQLTPAQFLIVSSPSKGKIVYTELRNFKSLTGRVFALVDSGLSEPAGLAFDNAKGYLYVADRGVSKIFRYRVLVQESGGRRSLATDGVRLCIMEGHPVEWVGTDPEGSVYFSDTGANTVNKISADVLKKIGEGAYQCGNLQTITQRQKDAKQLAALAGAARSLSDHVSAAGTSTDSVDASPEIVAVYEGGSNPHVTVPAGVSSDGSRLWWGNTVEGTHAGSVVQGQAAPESLLTLTDTTPSPQTPPAAALTSVAETTYGVAHSNTMVFFTTNKTGSGSVYGTMSDGSTTKLISGLVAPRGLAWDGDYTMYVADQGMNKVYSFPAGRFMDDAPLTQSAVYEGAFGVALYSTNTNSIKNVQSSSTRIRFQLWLWLLFILRVGHSRSTY